MKLAKLILPAKVALIITTSQHMIPLKSAALNILAGSLWHNVLLMCTHLATKNSISNSGFGRIQLMVMIGSVRAMMMVILTVIGIMTTPGGNPTPGGIIRTDLYETIDVA